MKAHLRYYLTRAWKALTLQPQTVCAWCLKERGEAPKATDSHGMCPRHLRQLRAELKSLSDFPPTGGKRLAESASSAEAKQHGNEHGPDSRRSRELQRLSGHRVMAACGDGPERRTPTYAEQALPTGSPGRQIRSGDGQVCASWESLAAVRFGFGKEAA